MSKPLSVIVNVANETFTFQLDKRELEIFRPVKIHYYWMDNRNFRGSGRSDTNLQSCLDHFWAVMKLQGELNHPDTQTSLILAEIFPYVKKQRSLQKIYSDAIPHPSADRERLSRESRGDHRSSRLGARDYMLPEDEEARINELVSKSGIQGVKQELDSLFLAHRPDPKDRDTISGALNEMIELAREALEAGGREGLQAHIEEVIAPRIKSQRKGNSRATSRFVLNSLSYESKVSFFTAYANAWISLVSRLKEDSLLDPPSERLMRLWHYQYQPSEANDVESPSDRWLFCGQVLALHPLSSFVFENPCFLIPLFAWLDDPDFQSLEAGRNPWDSRTYRNFLAMILKAGHVYRHYLETGEAKRNRTRGKRYGGSSRRPYRQG